MSTDESERGLHRRAQPGFRWDGVERRPYKEDGRALFSAITRQVLFSHPEMKSELRYFEVAPGGYSTLERHQHLHAVLILRGSGECLVGDNVHALATSDLVTVPAWTWHQFRANKGEPLGFLCMVDVERDRPMLPTEADLADLRTRPAVAAFLVHEPERV